MMTTLQSPSKAVAAGATRLGTGGGTATVTRLPFFSTLTGASLTRRPFSGTAARRLAEIALPDGAAIELDRHPVLGEQRAFMPIVGPDVAGPIDPGARRLAGLVEQVQIVAVLGDVGGLALQAGGANLDAPELAGEIDALRGRIGRGE